MGRQPLARAPGLALYGAIGAGFSALALVVAQAKSPEHDPIAHFISELALGDTAPLFATSFWVLGPSIVAIAAAFHITLRASRERGIGVGLLGLSALGVVALPFFPMSPPNGYTTPQTVVHGTIATCAFLSLNAGIVVLTRAASIEPLWLRYRNRLSAVALIGIALLVVFIGMVAVAEMDKGHPVTHFLGAVERVLIATNLAWCLMATGGLRSAHHGDTPAATTAHLPGAEVGAGASS